MPLNTVIIQPLQPADLQAAARLCALAMLNNPLHIQVFGSHQKRRQQRLTRLFSGLLPYIVRNGELMAAYTNGQLIGVLGRLWPGYCQPRWQDLLRLAPLLVACNSPFGTIKTRRWLSQWAALDPSIPHWHLGPLAVAPHHQRQGIGRSLMEYAIKEAAGVSLYLETDKLSNVQFYQRLDFQITATPLLLGTQTWLMLRKAAVSDKP